MAKAKTITAPIFKERYPEFLTVDNDFIEILISEGKNEHNAISLGQDKIVSLYVAYNLEISQTKGKDVMSEKVDNITRGYSGSGTSKTSYYGEYKRMLKKYVSVGILSGE